MPEIIVIGVNKSNYKTDLKADNVIKVPEIFIKDWYDKRSYQVWRGSRFSAKSHTKALQLLLKAEHAQYFRAIFARNTQIAARDSQFQLFKDLLDKYPILKTKWDINESKMMLIHKEKKFFIKGGSFEKSDSLMSIPELTDFWVEEPISRTGSIKREDFLNIYGTLRSNVEGIKPQIHFTFNPIGKDNFIYEDFFGEKKKYDDSNFNDFVVNYPDNCFVQDSSVEFLEHMKIAYPKRYLVDGLGYWGEPSNDDPFFHHYDDDIHFSNYKFPLLEDVETWLTFDFNYDPTTCTVIQVHPNAIIAKRCYKIKGGTKKLCTLMKEDPELMATNKLSWTITGDTSGTNKGASAGDVTDYSIIQKEFAIMDSQIVNVNGRNKAHVYSRRLCDYFFWKVPFIMDARCEPLRSDLIKAMATKDGLHLYKNRESGYGMDFLDNFRYFVDAKFKYGVDDIDNFVKILK